MKTIDLSRRKVDLPAILRLAEKGPVLLQSAGQEFVISKADDFEDEVQALRKSSRFQRFLDRRMKDSTWVPFSKIEEEVAADLRDSRSPANTLNSERASAAKRRSS